MISICEYLIPNWIRLLWRYEFMTVGTHNWGWGAASSRATATSISRHEHIATVTDYYTIMYNTHYAVASIKRHYRTCWPFALRFGQPKTLKIFRKCFSLELSPPQHRPCWPSRGHNAITGMQSMQCWFGKTYNCERHVLSLKIIVIEKNTNVCVCATTGTTFDAVKYSRISTYVDVACHSVSYLKRYLRPPKVTSSELQYST